MASSPGHMSRLEARLHRTTDVLPEALIIIETSSSIYPSDMLVTKTAVGDEEDGQCDSPGRGARPCRHASIARHAWEGKRGAPRGAKMQ
jgi:hypothetical protein